MKGRLRRENLIDEMKQEIRSERGEYAPTLSV
jgi:hypothetical protein